jgi:hypothetical protein
MQPGQRTCNQRRQVQRLAHQHAHILADAQPSGAAGVDVRHAGVDEGEHERRGCGWGGAASLRQRRRVQAADAHAHGAHDARL